MPRRDTRHRRESASGLTNEIYSLGHSSITSESTRTEEYPVKTMGLGLLVMKSCLRSTESTSITPADLSGRSH